MTSELLPHVALLPARISDIAALPDGSYAVATASGVYPVDANLGVGAEITADGGKLAVLPDGRLVVQGSTMRIGTPPALEKIELGEYQRGLLVTDDGFIAHGSDRIVIDRAGVRATVKLGKDRYAYVAAWRGQVAIADKTGLQIVDAAGTEVARTTDVYLTGAPIVSDEYLVVPGLLGLHVFDGNAKEVSSLACEAGIVQPFAGGVLVATKPDYASVDPSTRVQWIGLDAGTLVARWTLAAPRAREIEIVGERIVLIVEAGVWIVDASGRVIEKLEGLGYVRHIAAFEDGIVILADDRRAWWRPDGTTDLHYDGELNFARTVPAGLATAEGEVLQIWRTDAQGPVPVALTTDLPLNVPIVIDGARMTIEGTNRFTLAARSGPYVFARSPAYKAWRPVTTREQAAPLLERLVARTFDGALPAIPTGAWQEQIAELAQLPLAQSLDLVGKGLFAPSTLSPELAKLSIGMRGAFLAELATALDTRPRLLLAGLRARKLKLSPPRAVPADYDYLGSFTTSGALTVADPCYLGRKNPSAAMGLSLSLKLAAAEGLWHAFVRAVPGGNGELVAVQEDAFAVYASELAGNIGVDAGCAGVFDKACAKPNLDHGIDEGTLGGLGAVVWSNGDGVYPVFVGKQNGKVAKIRVAFRSDAPEVDNLLASTATTAAAKPYSASAAFATGDTISHVKFGVGSVIAAANGKIDVRFADGTRTLVHAKK